MAFTKSIFEQFWRSYWKKTIFVVFHFLKFLPSKGQRELCPPAYTGAAVLALCVFVDCMRPTIHQCNWTRPQLIHLCFCLSSWHCLWNSQSWSPRLLARQIWGDHPSRRPALHCQACSSQFKHRWRRCKRDSTLAIMSINADCLHVCMSACLSEIVCLNHIISIVPWLLNENGKKARN